jgi:uncharacterized CHY-type Zn-finger protein
MPGSLLQPSTLCKACLLPIHEGEPTEVCPSCAKPFHKDCWEEVGGCAVYGCDRMIETHKAETPIAYWGASEKVCPLCAETIPMEALECPYCKMVFDDICPLSREEALQPQEDPALARYRRRAGWLLFFSALGCTSPFALFFGGIWYLREKERIAQAGPAVRGVVLISFLIALVYLLVLPVGWAVFHLHPPT